MNRDLRFFNIESKDSLQNVINDFKIHIIRQQDSFNIAKYKFLHPIDAQTFNVEHTNDGYYFKLSQFRCAKNQKDKRICS